MSAPGAAAQQKGQKTPDFLAMPDLRTMTATQAADALVTTEAFYVERGLRVLDEFRRRLLGYIQLDQTIISEQAINDIFLTTEQLYDFNSGLLKQLQTARWEGIESFLCDLGAILDRLLPFFRLYTTFVLSTKGVMSQTKALALNNKSFRSFLEINELVSGTSLTTLLSAPMNRLPQYITFLGAIHSALPPAHPAAVSLDSTINKVQDVMDSISKQAENTIRRDRVVKIQQEYFRGDVALVDPTRKYIRQGQVFAVQDAKRKSESMLSLFNDCLILSARGFIGINVKGIIQLAGLQVTLVPDVSGAPHSFKLSSSLGGSKEEWWLQAESDRARTRWLTDIVSTVYAYYGWDINEASAADMTSPSKTNTRQFNTQVLHPEEFSKMIKKKSHNASKTLPKPEPSIAADVLELTTKRSKKPAAAAAAAAPVAVDAAGVPIPATPARPTTSIAGRRASALPAGSDAAAAAAATAAAAAPPAAPEPEPEAVVFDPSKTPAVVGDWERLHDPNVGAYYYEHLTEAYTQWDVPEPYVEWFTTHVVGFSDAEVAAKIAEADARNAAAMAGEEYVPPAPAAAAAVVPPPAPVAEPAAPAAAVPPAPPSAVSPPTAGVPSPPHPPATAGGPPPPPVAAAASVPPPPGPPAAAAAGGSGAPPPPPMLDFDFGTPSAPPAAAAAPAAGGAGGSRPPPPPGDLFSAIRGGATLNKVGPPPAPAAGGAGGGDLFAQIRGGLQLKKASAAPPPAPVEEVGQDALLSAIRGGLQLKKVDRTAPPAAPAEDAGPLTLSSTLQESLAKYRKFVQKDDDDDNDDDDEDW